MDARLERDVVIYNAIRERLTAFLGEGAADSDIMRSLETQSDLHMRLLVMAREAQRCEAFAEAMQSIIKDNQERKARFERKKEKLRELIAWAMQETDLPKIPAPDLTISQRMGKAPLVIDGEAGTVDHSAKYVLTKEVHSWNKERIRADLEAGDELSFARLGNPQPVLTIRTK